MNPHVIALLCLYWQLLTHPGWTGLAMKRTTKVEDGYDIETAYYAGPNWAVIEVMDDLKAQGYKVERSWV